MDHRTFFEGLPPEYFAEGEWKDFYDLFKHLDLKNGSRILISVAGFRVPFPATFMGVHPTGPREEPLFLVRDPLLQIKARDLLRVSLLQ